MPLSLKIVTRLVMGMLLTVPLMTISQEMPLKAQKEIPKHSVSKAAIYSAVLPGLGQGYNKKYWKIPVIYAGFGVIGYFVVTNSKEYQKFKEAYLYVANGDTTAIDNPYATKYDESQLKEGMEYYRRNRDLSVIVGVLWYTLNILEAYVDAHFFDYDISDDLTMHVGPAAVAFPHAPVRPAPGIKLALKF
jgi:hypothetical protein